MRLLIFTMILQKKVKTYKITTKKEQAKKFWRLLILLKSFFDEQPDTNMHDLEIEESAAQNRNQQGKDLKILTPNKMLSRLPISLVQLKA